MMNRLYTDPVLHSNLWSIVKNVSRYADSEAENQAIDELKKLINQQVLQALEEVKSKQQNLWTEMASDGNEYRIKAVPLSAIEQIEESYK